MKVRVTKRAQAQIDRAAQWWDENRDLAPEAFDEDLAKAFFLLSVEPGIGAPALHAHALGVRRLHLVRMRYHLYYRVRGGEVEVLAVCTHMTPNHSLNRTARRRRLRAVRSQPVSLVRWASCRSLIRIGVFFPV